MNKVFKILLTGLISLFIILQINCIYAASDINMNLNNTSKKNTNDEEIEEQETAEDTEDTEDTEETVNNKNSSIGDTLHSLPEAELGLSNVLNIILIAVGIVLILLAIAIFIKLK